MLASKFSYKQLQGWCVGDRGGCSIASAYTWVKWKRHQDGEASSWKLVDGDQLAIVVRGAVAISVAEVADCIEEDSLFQLRAGQALHMKDGIAHKWVALVDNTEVVTIRWSSRRSKIVTLRKLAIMRKLLSSKSIVWTHGCYDLLHPGHVYFLRQSRFLGDLLVVGINTDKNVTRFKGATRPVMNEDDRAAMVAELPFVDYVLIYAGCCSRRVARVLRPTVYTRVDDYSTADIAREVRAVEQCGGRLVIIPRVGPYSTTAMVERVVSRAVTVC